MYVIPNLVSHKLIVNKAMQFSYPEKCNTFIQIIIQLISKSDKSYNLAQMSFYKVTAPAMT